MSSLTGESELVPRTPVCTSEIAEKTRNLAFYETTVGEGIISHKHEKLDFHDPFCL